MKSQQSHRCLRTFSDGRRCTMLRKSGHRSLCAFHAQEEDRRLESEKLAHELAQDLSSLSGNFNTGLDINHALGKVFKALAQRKISAREANAFAYIAQLMLHSMSYVKNEIYWATQDSDAYYRMIRESIPAFRDLPKRQPMPQQQPRPASSQSSAASAARQPQSPAAACCAAAAARPSASTQADVPPSPRSRQPNATPASSPAPTHPPTQSTPSAAHPSSTSQPTQLKNAVTHRASAPEQTAPSTPATTPHQPTPPPPAQSSQPSPKASSNIANSPQPAPTSLPPNQRFAAKCADPASPYCCANRSCAVCYPPPITR